MTLEDLAFASVSPFPAKTAERPAAHARNLLALDLGSKTGWAVRRRDGSMSHGTERFLQRKGAHPGARWADFRAWLFRTISAEQVHAIAYERVYRHVGTDAAHVYGAFEAMMQMVAAQHNVELVPVGVGTIKKAWTGNGAADKAAMMAEARRRGFKPTTHDESDALAILSWAATQEGKK